VQIHESSLHQPDGAVRDQVAGRAGEPRGARRRPTPVKRRDSASPVVPRRKRARGERPRQRHRGRRRGPRLTPAPILAHNITRRQPPAPSAPAPSR
jgi:hypothetical protein